MTTAVVPFTEDDLHELYTWVDEIPLSRPKRNIARDFADGCCVAEIVKFFFPKLVELHNYTPAMSRAKKLSNWSTLNARVFRKLFFEVPPAEVEDIINAVPGAIERFLRALRIKIAQIVARREQLMKLAITQSNDKVNNDESDDDDDKEEGERQDGKGNNIHNRVNNAGKNTACTSPRSTQLAQNRSNSKTQHNTISDRNNNNNNFNKHRPNMIQSYNDDDDDDDHQVATPSSQVLRALLNEKDRTILELRETIGILSEKIVKLEELVKVKDDKLNQYRSKFGRFSEL